MKKNYKKLAESILAKVVGINGDFLVEAINVEPLLLSIKKISSYNEVPNSLTSGQLGSISFKLDGDNKNMFTLSIKNKKEGDLEREQGDRRSKPDTLPSDSNYKRVINFVKSNLSKIGQKSEAEFLNSAISSLSMYKIFTDKLTISIWVIKN